MDSLFGNVTFVQWILSVVAGIVCSYAASASPQLCLISEWKFPDYLEKGAVSVICLVITFSTYCLLQLLQWCSLSTRTLAGGSCEAKSSAYSKKGEKDGDIDDLTDENGEKISTSSSKKPEISSSSLAEENYEDESPLCTKKIESIADFDHIPETTSELQQNFREPKHSNPLPVSEKFNYFTQNFRKSSVDNFQRRDVLRTEEYRNQVTEMALSFLNERIPVRMNEIRTILRHCIEEVYKSNERLKQLKTVELSVLQQQPKNVSEHIRNTANTPIKSKINLNFKEKTVPKKTRAEALSRISGTFYSDTLTNLCTNMEPSYNTTKSVSGSENYENLEIKEVTPLQNARSLATYNSNYQDVSSLSKDEITSESANLEHNESTYGGQTEHPPYDISKVHSGRCREFLAKSGLLKKLA